MNEFHYFLALSLLWIVARINWGANSITPLKECRSHVWSKLDLQVHQRRILSRWTMCKTPHCASISARTVTRPFRVCASGRTAADTWDARNLLYILPWNSQWTRELRLSIVFSAVLQDALRTAPAHCSGAGQRGVSNTEVDNSSIARPFTLTCISDWREVATKRQRSWGTTRRNSVSFPQDRHCLRLI